VARELSRVSAVDNALPAHAIADLRAQLIEAPSNGDSGTYWYSLDAPPRHVFERVIQHLQRLVPRGNDMIGAEWWFRATATDTEFPFHFDRDEGIRSSIVSPAVASILYLSNAGGPTVILDATPSRRTAPSAGVAVHPRPGRFMMFPGTLLHGVLPGQASRWPRVTMLVNWWRSVPRLERATTELAPSPCRWRALQRDKTSAVALETFDPTRLLTRAAWREVIAKQATYK
jgi:hypothetical protein